MTLALAAPTWELDSDDMEWPVPEYSRSEVNAAGRKYAEGNGSMEPIERAEVLAVINNWRAAHSYPLQSSTVGLRRIAKRFDADPLIARRTKRRPSIAKKLLLRHGMDLSRMNDIGGCRAVLADVDTVKAVTDYYLHKSRHEHDLVKEYPYIEEPQATGYRGVHLVYKHHSSQGHWNGLRIEIQLRTGLQHAWATAVETVGLFEGQALKSNIGDADTLRLFALMGTAIANREGTPPVPETPTDSLELQREVRRLARSTNIVHRLQSIRVLLQNEVQLRSMPGKFFLLDLDVEAQSLRITPYKRRSQAEQVYETLEQELAEDPNHDVVLVSVDDIALLRRAYPNYFMDTRAFIDVIEEVIR